jgi:hypothetical protein
VNIGQNTDERKGAIIMIQGTTPTHKFTLPFEFTDDCDIETFRIAYEQNGKVVLTKEHQDENVTTESCGIITVKLTQEETLMFDENCPVRIQLHLKMTNGDALASKPKSVPVYVLLDRRAI